jgi:dihydrodipicolinate reductase
MERLGISRAGCRVCGRRQGIGVKITSDLKPLLKNADAIIDFSTGDVISNTRMASKPDSQSS